MEDIVDWFKRHWFLLGAVLAVGIAWGETVNKVHTLEDAIKSNAEVSKEVVELKSGQSRLDERTQNMQKDQAEQRQILLEILNSQRRLEKK